MRVSVLDHGYIEVIETWGSDERIIEAARMSTGKGFEGWGPVECDACGGMGTTTHDILVGGTEHDTEERDCKRCKTTGKIPKDEKLLRFLYEHKHTTPFEMAGITIEVQAPIFVFREWHRHRTQSYNEMSARYIPLPDVNYIPTINRLMDGAVLTGNKQAGGFVSAPNLGPDHCERFQQRLQELYTHAQEVYNFGLMCGIPKELARLPVPVARYSRMRASANLLNWLRFLRLRMATNAQWEIRQYALYLFNEMCDIFPRTMDLFKEEISNA